MSNTTAYQDMAVEGIWYKILALSPWKYPLGPASL